VSGYEWATGLIKDAEHIKMLDEKFMEGPE
jgi:hypothetical protein